MKQHPLYRINQDYYTVIKGSITKLSYANRSQTEAFVETLIANSKPSLLTRIKRALKRHKP